MKHGVDSNQNLHKGLLDPYGNITGIPEAQSNKLLQRADCVWSRMTLEKDEVLFVKVSLAAAHNIETISYLIDKAFGSKKDQVLVFVEGTLELTKVSKDE